jgi:hypothetical protein
MEEVRRTLSFADRERLIVIAMAVVTIVSGIGMSNQRALFVLQSNGRAAFAAIPTSTASIYPFTEGASRRRPGPRFLRGFTVPGAAAFAPLMPGDGAIVPADTVPPGLSPLIPISAFYPDDLGGRIPANGLSPSEPEYYPDQVLYAGGGTPPAAGAPGTGSGGTPGGGTPTPPVLPVPEPQTWGMIVAGLFVTGLALRVRRLRDATL